MRTKQPGNEAASLVPCPCGEDAVWYRPAPRAEDAPEHAACLLADADFADNYCDDCFPLAVPPKERATWKRLGDEPGGG